jgi:hypothetical protein
MPFVYVVAVGGDTPPITRKDLPRIKEGPVYHLHNVQRSPGGEKELGTMNPVVVRETTADMSVSNRFDSTRQRGPGEA